MIGLCVRSSFQHDFVCYQNSSDEDKVLDLREGSRLLTQIDSNVDAIAQNDLAHKPF